jgi:putative ABC transport system substrate-binding protein
MAARKYTLHRTWARQATVGFLGATNPTVWGPFLATFEKRMRELGWIDGANIAVEQHWSHGRPDLHPGFAHDFAGREVDVIVTSGTQAVVAAKKEAKTIPIVFASAGDPVRTKLVKTLKKPGGNVTGLSNGQTGLARRRLDELRKMVPELKRLAILANVGSSVIPLEIAKIKKRAKELRIATVVCDVRKAADIGPAIKKLRGKADALYVCTDPFITTHQVAINTAAASAHLPTMHAFREYVDAGGLMSYGPDFRAMFGKAADLTDKILRGTKPADLAVKVQTKCELVINPHTAHALGLRIPKAVRRRATLVR